MAEPDSHPNPSILSHVSIGTNDFVARSGLLRRGGGRDRRTSRHGASRRRRLRSRLSRILGPRAVRWRARNRRERHAHRLCRRLESRSRRVPRRRASRRAPPMTANPAHAPTMANPTTVVSCAIPTDTRSKRRSGMSNWRAGSGWRRTSAQDSRHSRTNPNGVTVSCPQVVAIEWECASIDRQWLLAPT